MLSAVLTLVLLAPQDASPAPDDPARVLREADLAFCRATTERGLEGWLAWFADDAVVFPAQGGLVSGSAPIRAHYTALAFPPAGFRWEPEQAGLAASGDLGWTTGRWGLDDGKQITWRGHYLSVWRRAEDGWKVVADCGGEPDFARRAPGLAGAPVALGREAARTFRARDGSLEATLGEWWARDAEGGECGGTYLSVWRRLPAGGFELAAETGLATARR